MECDSPKRKRLTHLDSITPAQMKNHQHLTRRAALPAILAIWFLASGILPAAEPSASTGAPKVAVVVSTLSNPWFVVLANSARDRAKALGYEATIFDSKNDLAQETAAFEKIIAEGYRAVLLNAIDAKGSIDNVRQAGKAGIPVFCMDRVIAATDAAVSQVVSNNYGGCVMLGEYFISQLGEKGSYIELLGLAGDTNTWSRSKGFHSTVDKYPEMKMVAQVPADFDRAKAEELLGALLKQHPNVSAVFCGNDAMALGAYDAVQAAGMSNKVKVFGFDGADEVVKSVAKDGIAATVMQFPNRIATTAAEYADQHIKGKKVDARITVPVELVTRHTVRKFLAGSTTE